MLPTALALALTFGSTLPAADRAPQSWRAWLEVPGGELTFGLELAPRDDGGWEAFLVNDPERIPVPLVRWDGSELLLEMTHYDSRITATLDGERLRGTWEKLRGVQNVARVPFVAEPVGLAAARPSTAGLPKSVRGRWAVDFESDELLSVGLFEQEPASPLVRGTFLTHTGDYRYLAGSIERGQLTLSCFDGAHAFLFKAELVDERLEGHFWSGDWWHETWTAVRDEDARLGDAFQQTAWNAGTGLADLIFPDPTGQPVSLTDPRFAGRPMLLQVFGTWCPNCNDETDYLGELHGRYGERGLSIVGLAFELTDDFDRNARQVEAYRARHGVRYPMLLAGPAGKPASTAALGALDFVRSYPTTIFLDKSGEVRAVHSGFSGPATGAAHAALRREFEGRIEALLAEAEPSAAATESALIENSPWASDRGTGRQAWQVGYRFTRGDDGTLACSSRPVTTGRSAFGETALATTVHGSTVSLDQSWFSYRLDARASVLLHPLDVGARLYPVALGPAPLFHERSEAEILAALAPADAVLCREALIALAARRTEAETGAPEALALLEHPDPQVRRTAAWVLGVTGTESALQALVEALAHPNAGVRREALEALVRLLPEGDGLDELLLPLVHDADPFVRERVAELRGEAPR